MKTSRSSEEKNLKLSARQLVESRKSALAKVVECNGDNEVCDPTDLHFASLEKRFRKDEKYVEEYLNRPKLSLVQRVFHRAFPFRPQGQDLSGTISSYQLSRLADSYTKTTKSRSKHSKLSDVAFMNEKVSPTELLEPLSVSNEWTTSIKLLNVTDSKVWGNLNYSEDLAMEWWRSSVSSIRFPDNKAWAEMKALSKAIIFLVDEDNFGVETEAVEEAKHKWIIPVFESLKVFMMDMIRLLCAFPEYAKELAGLFGYAIPIVFLTSRKVKELRLRLQNHTSAVEDYYDQKFKALNALIGILVRKIQVISEKIDEEKVIETASLYSRDKKLEQDLCQSTTALNLSLDAGLVKDKEEANDLLEELNSKSILYPNFMRSPTYSESPLSLNGLNEVRVSPVRSSVLGSGTYSVIYKGASPNGKNWYAIKEALIHRDEKSTWNRVGREAKIWMKLRHRNIHPLIGYCFLPSTRIPALVMDICRANLSELAQICGEVAQEMRLKLLRDVADGLNYIHSLDIAHGDLRANNVLIKYDDSGECYAALCDFGISYCLTEQDDPSMCTFKATAGQVGNPGWLAPELLEKDLCNRDGMPSVGIIACISFPGDMYAFGCVFLEVMFGREPYCNEAQSMICSRKREGMLPASLEETSAIFYPFLKRLWNKDEMARPTASQVIEILDEFIAGSD